MRKIFLTVILASLLINTATAQIKKGSIFLGGDIGGTGQKTKSNDITVNKQSGVNISPVIGTAIKENLIVGINGGFGFYNSSSDINLYKNESDSYSFALFIRKYKKLGASDFYLFAQGSAGIAHYTQSQKAPAPNNLDEIKRLTAGISAYPGLSYAVSNKIQLETGFNSLVSLNYFTEKREVTNNPGAAYKSKGFSVTSSLSNATSSLFLGIRVLLGK
jgi:hypothetical protein